MTESGRCAVAGGISRIPKSWRGWRSIARKRRRKDGVWKLRSSVGERSGTKFTGPSVKRVMTRSSDSFTQSFGSPELDASLLLIPAVGFLSAADPRVAGTIAAIERELTSDGFVLRYRKESGADGLPGGEGVFLACSFWLADAYQLQGRAAEANRLLDRLLSLRNDLGLLSEEYDTHAKRQVGNFPQAFSHLSLVRSVLNMHEQRPVREVLSSGPRRHKGETLKMRRSAIDHDVIVSQFGFGTPVGARAAVRGSAGVSKSRQTDGQLNDDSK